MSLLLFIIVMEAITRNLRKGLPWELLYADDLVLMADSLDELKVKLTEWKAAMESKGLKVNLKKTKVIFGKMRKEDQSTGKYPCVICRKGVGGNSIQCKKCKGWVHKKCSGIKGRLPTSGRDYECRKCQERGQGELPKGDTEDDEEELEWLEMGRREKIEVVKSFCYLGI